MLYPSRVGPAVLAGQTLDRDGKVATRLGETRVWFDEIAAPLAYAVSGEVGAVVPYEVSNRKTTEVVVEYQGLRSPPVTLAIVESAPALFTLDASGKGQAAMLNETGCCNSAHNPAARGSVAALYATGEGQTRPAGITGSVSAHERIADYPGPELPLAVTVGGAPAEILYAGGAPHAVAGLLQVNFRVPANAPLGDQVPIVLAIGNNRSPDGVTMAIRSPVQRILVMDPDVSTRNSLLKTLVAAGYEVLIARNAREFLAAADHDPVDLVICSLAMSENDRLEAIRALRAKRPQLRIIATAGTLAPAALRAADLLGAQAIFDPANLVGNRAPAGS